MAAPNIVNVTSILGKCSVLAVTNSATAIVTCASSTVVKINALYCSNIHATTAGAITVDVYRGATASRIANAISVPINSTLDVVSKAIYLEEGDTLRLTANASSYIEAVCSYEIIS
jgi:hypothetical protein